MSNPPLDALVESIGALCWAQDQGEQLVRNWMDQGKLARQQGQEMVEQLADQTKKNQIELQKFIHNSVALSMDTMKKTHEMQMQEMQNQVQQMSEMMQTLQAQVENINKK